MQNILWEEYPSDWDSDYVLCGEIMNEVEKM